MSVDNISFDLPKNKSNVIKVIGVGGGGSNAVNYMFKQGIDNVDFVICNTDAQALQDSPVPNKIQLGVNLTEGLGAGANPEIGVQSAKENIEEIKSMLNTNTKMIFLTAGMGGGTGTGAAPVIAKLASELNILTVGIVTVPFQFEGKTRLEQAQKGIDELRKYVDSLIVINNSKLRDIYGNLGYKSGFAKADEVLATAARGISQIITKHYGLNIDLHDAKTVLKKSGTAIMGSAEASGENRAMAAISKALESPLLNDNKITGAKQVLLLISSGEEEITIDEMSEITEFVLQQSGGMANVILGLGDDLSLGNRIALTVIATGFPSEKQDQHVEKAPERRVHVLDEERKEAMEIDKVPTGKLKLDPPPAQNVLDTKVEAETVTPQKIVHKLFEDEEENIDSEEEKKSFNEPIVKDSIIGDQKEQNNDTSIDETNELIDAQDYGQIEATQEVEENIEFDSFPIEDELQEEVDSNEIESENQQVESDLPNSTEQIKAREESQTTLEFVFDDIDNHIEGDLDELDSIEEFENEETSSENQIQETEIAPETNKIVYTLDDFDTEQEEELEIDNQYTAASAQIEETESESESNQVFNDGSRRYNLEDFTKIEKHIENAKPTSAPNLFNDDLEIEDPELSGIVLKSVEAKVEDKPLPAKPVQNQTEPTDLPLDMISRVAIDRLNRLRKFNYSFKNKSMASVDENSKEPAYVRAGIEISDKPKGDSRSRTIYNGSSDGFSLKTNNSFLHDNVD